MNFLGTHGTCASRAKEIIRQGFFEPSGHGWLGSGSYFWAYQKDISLAKRRAELWWVLKSSKNEFNGESDKSCAVLKVEINLAQDELYLDADEDEFLESFYEAIKFRDPVTQEELALAFAWFVRNFEQEIDLEFLVIRVSVPNPPLAKKQVKDWVHVISKMAPAYIVKEKGANLVEKICLVD